MSVLERAVFQEDAESELSVWPDEMLAPAAKSPALPLQQDRRRYERQPTAATVTGVAGPWYHRRRFRGVIINFSHTGFAIAVRGRSPRLEAGAPLQLTVSMPPAMSGRPRLRRYRLRARAIWMHPTTESPQTLGVRLAKLLPEWVDLSEWVWRRRAIAVVIFGLLAAIAFLKARNVIWFWYDPAFQFYSVLVSFFLLSRTLFGMLYRPPEDVGYLPPVSVVVAVKNEAAHITETVERIFQSRYPRDRLEVLVVDDGSTDGTWEVLREVARRYPALGVFRFAANRGKRHAMALGAERGRGEILVCVDSDSFLDPEGIYRIVQGFADPRVGAISGHCKAIIEPSNPISKMEAVRYFVSHHLMKGAESMFGCVTCCPGVFSAYRRSVMMPILPAWLNQTFLGNPATFGDDRSLTNFTLRRYRVIYADHAQCSTYVPSTWGQYFRQQLRWKKSFARETLMASRIMWRKHPIAAATYYVSILLTLLAPVMVLRNMVVLPLAYSMSCLPYLGGLALVYLLLSCVYVLRVRHSRAWLHLLIFAVMYVAVMCWQNYYAIATVRRAHWGTR